MHCFVDASYSSQHHIAVLGFQVGDESRIHLTTINVNGIAAAEKMNLQRCIEYCSLRYPTSNLIVYTDHEPSLKQSFPDHVRIVFTPGHIKKADMTTLQLRFSLVDKAVRKELRRIIGNM